MTSIQCKSGKIPRECLEFYEQLKMSEKGATEASTEDHDDDDLKGMSTKTRSA